MVSSERRNPDPAPEERTAAELVAAAKAKAGKVWVVRDGVKTFVWLGEPKDFLMQHIRKSGHKVLFDGDNIVLTQNGSSYSVFILDDRGDGTIYIRKKYIVIPQSHTRDPLPQVFALQKAEVVIK